MAFSTASSASISATLAAFLIFDSSSLVISPSCAADLTTASTLISAASSSDIPKASWNDFNSVYHGKKFTIDEILSDKEINLKQNKLIEILNR